MAVGQIGLFMVISGMVGMMIIGVLLDKTHKFKLITLIAYVLTLVGMLAFAFGIVLGKPDHLWVLYMTAIFLGFFQTGYLPLGFEFAAEITYPISEGITSNLLNASAQGFGLIMTFGTQKLIDAVFLWKPVFSGLLLILVLLAVGTVMTVFIKEELRRTRTETRGRVDSFFSRPAAHSNRVGISSESESSPDLDRRSTFRSIKS